MSFRNYYDSTSYNRNRDATRSASSTSTERPTTVTAKYTTTPSYKSSSIPVPSERGTREETPISTIANRYANYNKTANEKSTTPKYEKKDYTKLTIPSISTNRSRDVSPVSASSKYSLTRHSRHSSPERKVTKSYKDKSHENIHLSERDKDIPTKTEKSSGYNSLSNFKLYPRPGSYTRPSTRTEQKTDISNYPRASTRVDIKPEVTVNRYAIANRLATPSYLRSPTPIKRSSLSTSNHVEIKKPIIDKPLTSTLVDERPQSHITTVVPNTDRDHVMSNDKNDETETITVITRHTSPTPPGSSSYVRIRRADLAKTIEKIITRKKTVPETADKEIQSDRLDDPTRSSRFGSTSRSSVTNWTYYSPSVNNYTGYAGRYSTQYSNLRENAYRDKDRSSRSRSKEPVAQEVQIKNSELENSLDSNRKITSPECNQNIVNIYETDKDNNETSEIIINVNLKLKKSQSPSAASLSEIVAPEITITNSQLPPQAPKTEGQVKTKKIKIRKSSTESSDSTTSKKVIKKRSKSVSSTDSEQSSDKNNHSNVYKSGLPKNLKKSLSNNKLNNLPLKSHKPSERKSSDSSLTLSSSVSEDENICKSKINDVSEPTQVDASTKSSTALQRNENGTEEAKSFLIRALAPVTNLFKIRHQEVGDSSRCVENYFSADVLNNESYISKNKCNTDNIVASNDDSLVKLKAIRHIESGDRSKWTESSTSNHKQCNQNFDIPPKQIRKSESNDSRHSSKKSFFADEEKPWWLDSNANIPEGIERLTPPRKSSSDDDRSEKYNFYKVRHIESGEQKDWRLTSKENNLNKSRTDVPNNICNTSNTDQRPYPIRCIRRVESGECPWWLSSSKNIPEGIEQLPPPTPSDESDSSDSDEVEVYMPLAQIPPFPLHLPDDEPLGDRRSPEGLETPKDVVDYNDRNSPYENRHYRRGSHNIISRKGVEMYISRFTDIDDILGISGQIYSPFMDSILAKRTGQIPFDDDECEEIDPTQVRIHDSTPQMPVIRKLHSRLAIDDFDNTDQLDDATLQVFKDGDYGPYLDLDSTLGEQDEELEGLQDNRKNALVLRTQLSVRVHSIIEQLIHSQGKDLRKALFAVKQMLQSDKDLVHEFVANNGLDCLMQVSAKEDQTYLDYILRAMGQILIYVDGMHGVMNHKSCIQWLYSLIASIFRNVVKTTLKLLSIFVEYTETNSLLLIDAINFADKSHDRSPWYNVMKILQDFDASDTELLICVMNLINICLINIPDRDKYYDQVDLLHEQGIDDIIQLYMAKQGTDLDLLRQLQIFDAVLLYEDGDETGTAIKQLDESIIKSMRKRNSSITQTERRKSKKYQIKEKANHAIITSVETEKTITNNIRSSYLLPSVKNYKESTELSTALRKRRDRFARQAHHIIQQEELLNNSSDIYNGLFGTKREEKLNGYKHDINVTDTNGSYTNMNGKYSSTANNFNGYINGYTEEDKSFNKTTKFNNLPDVLINGNQRYTTGLKHRIHNGTLGHSVNTNDTLTAIRQKQIELTPEKDDRGIIINREHSIKDLAQRLTSSVNHVSEEKSIRVSEMAGIVSKAKEELAKSQSKEIIKSPTIEKSTKLHEIKVSENDLHWEELRKGCLNREFHLCDLDFSDLLQDSDEDVMSCSVTTTNGPPPPPPSMLPPVGPPPLPGYFPPIPKSKGCQIQSLMSESSIESDTSTIKKNKKTVKLFWREIQENTLPPTVRPWAGGIIWDDLPVVNLDTAMLEHLFESRTNDLIIKKLMEPKRNLILDAKRSNAINIAMKKLPTPQTIKAAIMKMDATVIGREGIEKLLTMLPTEEEKVKIQEAQYANPDLPLGSAEQFLLTLASINELPSRLKLWVFKLDFDNLEKEIAEPLMDLKQGIELLKDNRTFKVILSTLRSVGSFLNGSQVKGFRLEYLSKVMEVKDTVHKHPLLYHICEMIIEKFSDTTDFFSEVGPVIRSSKVDFDVLNNNLLKLETDCKASWDHLKKVTKHDGSQIYKTKISDFITDAAERIILLTIIKKRVMNRYKKFLFYLGIPAADVVKTRPSDFLKVIAEFALEYRTTRERVLQQLEKRANHRERNKTRGKMIIDTGKYSTKSGDPTADNALKQLLNSVEHTDLLTEGQRRSQPSTRKIFVNGDLSADEEIIESLVRSATMKRTSKPRDRKKNRLCDKKIFNRTLDGHQSWPGRESNDESAINVQQR